MLHHAKTTENPFNRCRSSFNNEREPGKARDLSHSCHTGNVIRDDLTLVNITLCYCYLLCYCLSSLSRHETVVLCNLLI
jgi:hypothetical protein